MKNLTPASPVAEMPLTDSPAIHNPDTHNKILSFTPKAKPAPHQDAGTASQPSYIGVVTQVTGNMPSRVTIDQSNYTVVGYLSLMAGITPIINLGDQVFISAVEDGVVIHGVFTPIEAPTRASFGFKDDKLVIESQHAVILKSGDTTIELTEAGSIRIDGKEVRTKAKEVHTVAQKTLTLLGGTVNLN